MEISGRVDLLWSKQRQFADLKTGGRLSAAQLEDYALQMLIYQQALAAEGEQSQHWQPIVLHVTPAGIEDIPLSAEQLTDQAERLVRGLEQIVRLHASSKGPQPPPAPPCARCLYERWCPAAAAREV